MKRLRFLLRQTFYDLDTSLLFRPAAITILLALVAAVLPILEETHPEIGARLAWAVPSEAGAAQVVLGTVAGGVMTVASIVYSVLIVSLSLASVQFSPRLLSGFMRDRTSQLVLGLFSGTFTYCLLVLRSARSTPDPFVPKASVVLAIALALVCLASLSYFVHHMAQGIQANYIVDRIAHESEGVIDDVFVEPADAAEEPPAPPAPADAFAVVAPASGYVQLIEAQVLYELAASRGATIFVKRGVGQFVPEQGILAVVSPRSAAGADLDAQCARAFDIGPVRTMQDDVEFGVRQIVDVALKAISPAVNDPSTAVTCIDHLGRLLGRIARRGGARTTLRDPAGEPRVVLQRADFGRMIDLALNQIRQYGKGDMAVLLRVIRMLDDVAYAVRRPADLAAVRRHLAMVEKCGASFPSEDCDELERRAGALRERLEQRAA